MPIEVEIRVRLWHYSGMPKPVKQEPSSVDLSTSRLENGDSQGMPVPKAVSQYMAEIGRKGGQIGGKQRLKTMSAAERQKVAQRAARVRWERHNELERQN